MTGPSRLFSESGRTKWSGRIGFPVDGRTLVRGCEPRPESELGFPIGGRPVRITVPCGGSRVASVPVEIASSPFQRAGRAARSLRPPSTSLGTRRPRHMARTTAAATTPLYKVVLTSVAEAPAPAVIWASPLAIGNR